MKELQDFLDSQLMTKKEEPKKEKSSGSSSHNVIIAGGFITESLSHCDDNNGDYGYVKLMPSRNNPDFFNVRLYKQSQMEMLLKVDLGVWAHVEGKLRYDTETKEHYIQGNRFVIDKDIQGEAINLMTYLDKGKLQ